MECFKGFYRANSWPQVWPVLVDAVLAYCVYIHGVDLVPQTIVCCLTAISFGAQAIGLLNPCRDFRVRKAVEGWAKAASKHHDV